MSELTVEQVIKIIIGVLVFVVVVTGLYFFFNGKVADFFNNFVTPGKLFLSFI